MNQANALVNVYEDGSVLVSTGGSLQIGGQPWRAVRGLSGIVGWVPSAQVFVDGEGPPLMVAAASAPTPGTLAGNAPPTPIATANLGSAGATGERLRVANTDGVGVVLRNSPRDGDKSRLPQSGDVVYAAAQHSVGLAPLLLDGSTPRCILRAPHGALSFWSAAASRRFFLA